MLNTPTITTYGVIDMRKRIIKRTYQANCKAKLQASMKEAIRVSHNYGFNLVVNMTLNGSMEYSQESPEFIERIILTLRPKPQVTLEYFFYIPVNTAVFQQYSYSVSESLKFFSSGYKPIKDLQPTVTLANSDTNLILLQADKKTNNELLTSVFNTIQDYFENAKKPLLITLNF